MPLYKIFLPVKENRLRQITEASSCVRTEASYMVELSVALPFFTGFLAALLFFFQALCVQQEVGNALLAAGRELSVLACGREGEAAGLLPANALVRKNIKKNSAAERYIRSGRLGILLVHSDFSGDYIKLQADYRLRFPFGLFGRRDIKVTQRLTCRKWTGRGKKPDLDTEIVYITPAGSVYHKNRSCSYLNPSVNGADLERVDSCRNESGGKYYPCESCMKQLSGRGTVYITKYGNRFHSRRDCNKIKRTVQAVFLPEAAGRAACSKCKRGL